jgi:hypothetical protein
MNLRNGTNTINIIKDDNDNLLADSVFSIVGKNSLTRF